MNKERQVERLSGLLSKVQTNRQKLDRTHVGLGPASAPDLGARAAASLSGASPDALVLSDDSPTAGPRRTPAEVSAPAVELRAELGTFAPPIKPVQQPVPSEAPPARRDAGAVAAPLPAQSFPPEQPAPATETGIHEVASPRVRVIEAEPLRALTRPVAQVVSKQEGAVDATFGVMLKRSLSLRPR